MTYAEQHGIRTDATGWPLDVMEEHRAKLIASVTAALAWGPLPLHELYALARRDNALPPGGGLDMLYSCVDRAARAVDGVTQVYALPATIERVTPAVREYGAAVMAWRAGMMDAGGATRSGFRIARGEMRGARERVEAARHRLGATGFPLAKMMYGEIPAKLADEEM